jgi:hypothetical protein
LIMMMTMIFQRAEARKSFSYCSLRYRKKDTFSESRGCL